MTYILPPVTVAFLALIFIAFSSSKTAITEEQSASAQEIEATAVNIQELADTVSENSAGVRNRKTQRN